MAGFPNAYSTSPLINAASTAHTVFALTFMPRYLRIYNTTGADLYVDYTGNAPSTATSHYLLNGTALELNPVPGPIGEFALTTTTTGAGVRVSVLALWDQLLSAG